MNPGPWCGNTRRELGGCSSAPGATQSTYHVTVGTEAEVKRVREKTWRPFTVTTDLTFKERHILSSQSFTFKRSGWLLRVKKELVRIETHDVSNRFRRKLSTSGV